MDLPNLFSSTPNKDKLFLGLIMTEQTVQAILWKIANSKISAVKSSEIIHISNADEVIVKTDTALQELGELSENLSDVLLGLESSWVNPKGVIDAKKPLLKKLSEELALKPIGFVVTTEAITQFLSKEDPKLNSMLLFFATNKISVTLVEHGVLQKTESVGRSDDTVGDLTEALARFKSGHKKQLPTNIKLISVNLNTEEIFEQQQSLIATDWVKEGYFISTPNIEILDNDLAINGVVNQGGIAIAKSHGLNVSIDNSNDKVVESDSKDFAFKEVKVEEEIGKETEETKPTQEDDNLTAVPKSFGIPISSKKLPNIEKHQEVPMETAISNNKPEQNTKILPKKQNKLANWFHDHKKFALIGFLLGVFTLIMIFIGFITFSGSALVTLQLNPKSINKDIVITLDPKLDKSNFEEMALKSEIVSRNFFFNQTNETTGVTLVGEKAKGKIQISNKTDGVKTFPAGTSLQANGVRFTLDDDVTIASSSVEIKQAEEVKTYGSSEANITAVKIGAEANLDSDTSLVIGEFASSSYEARVMETLAGGSSREIRVVSEEDLNQLLSEVKKKILEIANQEYKDDSKNDEKITFISTNNITVTDENFSGKEGDEAKTISLELSADVEAISFQNGDIKPLAERVLSDLIPEGFEMVEKEPQILSDVNEESATSSAILVDANISTQAIPIIDYDLLKQELSNKSLVEAQSILTNKSDIKSAVIELSPKILESIWKKLPSKADKIEFKIN
ncbi:MAG: hypothetical protein GW941_00380 [Candidatus Pacebacteria bacterium]|nr:hypothetical protein [Candidatus Paceibacterota bacterium]